MLNLEGLRKNAITFLEEEASKIQKLIEVQIDNLKMPACPLYEDVLDTQLLGFSKQIDFAVRMEFISSDQGKAMISSLEKKLQEIVIE